MAVLGHRVSGRAPDLAGAGGKRSGMLETRGGAWILGTGEYGDLYGPNLASAQVLGSRRRCAGLVVIENIVEFQFLDVIGQRLKTA